MQSYIIDFNYQKFLLFFFQSFFVFAVSVYSDADLIFMVHLCTIYNNILLFIFLCYFVFVHPRNSCPVWLFPFWKVRLLFSPDLAYNPFSLLTRATYRGIHRHGHSGANRGIWGHFLQGHYSGAYTKEKPLFTKGHFKFPNY